MCGGTEGVVDRGFRLRGLSPRVRGNLDKDRFTVFNGGSIPACAGEPTLDLVCYAARTVYPRVCGGTRRSATPAELWKGLSPRVRGNRLRRRLKAEYQGSIPACAGEPRGGAW